MRRKEGVNVSGWLGSIPSGWLGCLPRSPRGWRCLSEGVGLLHSVEVCGTIERGVSSQGVKTGLELWLTEWDGS